MTSPKTSAQEAIKERDTKGVFEGFHGQIQISPNVSNLALSVQWILTEAALQNKLLV